MDDNFNDYFTDENMPEEVPQVHQETEQEREEREIKEATIERRGYSLKLLLILIILAMAAFIGWWVWQHYFHPYRQSQEKGWIMKVSSEGTVFKTYEGEMISDKYIEDTLVAMHSNFYYTITDDSLAREALRWAGNGERVIVSYNEYKGSVVWRGNSKFVVTNIERDSDRTILNPYQDVKKSDEEDK